MISMENNDAQFDYVIDLLKQAELDSRTEEDLRVFLFSLMDQPCFRKLINILGKNRDAFDDFTTAFIQKRRFLENGGTVEQWQYILDKEKEFLQQIGPIFSSTQKDT